MSKKKALKDIFYGLIGGTFSQKKKVSIGNVKHFGDEKDISLVKLGPSSGVYSDMNSVFGDSSNDDVFLGIDNNSLFNSAVNTLKAKKVNTDLVCGSLLGLIDYGIDEDNRLLPPPLKISLNRKKNMIKTASLAREKEINVNSNLKKQEICLDWAILARLYVKKNVSIACSTAFGGKLWAQVVLVVSVSHDSFAGSGSGAFSFNVLGSNGTSLSVLLNESPLSAYLSSLECFLKLLANQVSDIICKLSNIELVPLAVSPPPCAPICPLATKLNTAFDMILDNLKILPLPLSLVTVNISVLGLSSSKILTTKIGSLELKLVALEASVGSVLAKLDLLCAGSLEKAYQYALLEYVKNNAFSSVMNDISLEELVAVLVLKDISTQSPVFAVDSIVEDTFKKDHEIWIHDGLDQKRVEAGGDKFSFFAAGAFVNDTIWVENS
ncbi:hypothetical protein G9A89_009445 [Geosiphon pyriformis]|nr:hypothetical protein G9A89_009445 [Geosiphon pyriformis]